MKYQITQPMPHLQAVPFVGESCDAVACLLLQLGRAVVHRHHIQEEVGGVEVAWLSIHKRHSIIPTWSHRMKEFLKMINMK